MALAKRTSVSTMNYFGISICVLSFLVGIQADFYSNQINAAGYYAGPGYYWRDYYGTIPEDAFPTGDPNYFIGQLVKAHTLIPVLVKREGQDVVAEFTWAGQPYTQNKNFQIFSTSDASQFEWVKTNAHEAHLLMFNHQVIVGGYDDGLPTYIGRAFGNRKIGKVSTYPKWSGLMYVRNGEAVRDFSYEVLAYKK